LPIIFSDVTKSCRDIWHSRTQASSQFNSLNVNTEEGFKGVAGNNFIFIRLESSSLHGQNSTLIDD